MSQFSVSLVVIFVSYTCQGLQGEKISRWKPTFSVRSSFGSRTLEIRSRSPLSSLSSSPSSWQERQDFDFSSTYGWETFYREDPSFVTEWHDSIDFEKLVDVWVPHGARCLLPGSGTSRLPLLLLEKSCLVTLLDSSITCIHEMQQQFGDQMQYIVGDATQLENILEPNSYDIIIDKGLLDALLCGEGWETPMKRLLRGYSHVLTKEGRCILVSYRLANPTKQELLDTSEAFDWKWEFGVDPSNNRVEVSLANRNQL